MSDPADPGSAALATALTGGDRQALARAITLIESRREQDATAGDELLARILPATGRALRLGITGAPGVGKSTLIEALGRRLCDAGHALAVLAVDPSSSVTGGSILGDKTRMAELARHPRAFIRPSPGGGTLGGVAARTREALLLCEAAGHDIVIVETIGTGQSETAVHGMVDFFLLVLSPAAGDELQGIKRGAMELADGVLVHKADGDLAAAADRAAQQCMLAMRVLHAGTTEPPPVLVASSLTGRGLDELWQMIERHLTAARASGALERRRRQQATAWLDTAVRDRLLTAFLDDANNAHALAEARARVERGEALPGREARRLVPGGLA
ncbi:MAG: methylmalonyl Co-A mutase-associated GTPase MeaB [Planctomycetes bacterium]|nr:methylmalonyl Co-A mutase-associated GTPase MeaB [Planctomycetota bacterium]